MFSTKDRVELTKKSVAGIDVEGSNFDLIWIDGSETDEGKELPIKTKFRHCNLVDVYHGIKGDADKTPLHFGLRNLIQRDYDYCGIIESDIGFKKGWFSKMMDSLRLGNEDNLEVGAATVRTVTSRVLKYRSNYVIMWNLAAAITLFTKHAAGIIFTKFYTESLIKNDTRRFVYAKELQDFYLNRFGIDVRTNSWELFMGTKNRELSRDWGFAMELNKHGLFSVGSIPSMAFNIDHDMEKRWHTQYLK